MTTTSQLHFAAIRAGLTEAQAIDLLQDGQIIYDRCQTFESIFRSDSERAIEFLKGLKPQ